MFLFCSIEVSENPYIRSEVKRSKHRGPQSMLRFFVASTENPHLVVLSVDEIVFKYT